VLNWLAEIIDALPQEDNGLLTLPLLLKLSHAIIDIGKKKKRSSSAVSYRVYPGTITIPMYKTENYFGSSQNSATLYLQSQCMVWKIL